MLDNFLPFSIEPRQWEIIESKVKVRLKAIFSRWNNVQRRRDTVILVKKEFWLEMVDGGIKFDRKQRNYLDWINERRIMVKKEGE